ncbi:MAG: META domain-containing protein, partial [Caldilinea sp.]
TPNSVPVNGCVSVAWNVGGDVKTIRILRNEVIMLDNAPTTGAGQNCLTDVGTYRYRLEAFGSGGQSSSAEVTVTVVAPEPTPTAEPPVGGAGTIDADLTGKTWALVSMFDGAAAMISPVAGSQITAQFGADGSLAGSAGCNNYSGGFTASGGVMTIGPTASTFMFCGEPAGVMDQESLYLALLPTVSTYVIANGQLTLANGVGQAVAVYVVGQ